jgi:DNA-binding NarL/FixJ family response regulator
MTGRGLAGEHSRQRVALTGRELLVLQLLARGYTRDQIAALLAVPSGEVERSGLAAHHAFGVASAAETVLAALRRGLIV